MCILDSCSFEVLVLDYRLYVLCGQYTRCTRLFYSGRVRRSNDLVRNTQDTGVPYIHVPGILWNWNYFQYADASPLERASCDTLSKYKPFGNHASL